MNTVAGVEVWLAKIEEEAGDDEEAHLDEDTVWEEVLRVIAAGETDDPAALAAAALRTLDIEFARWRA